MKEEEEEEEEEDAFKCRDGNITIYLHV